VVTGRPRRDAEAFLGEQGIRDLFGVVITMDEGPLKPDPTPCRMALEALGVTRAWMVGDTPDDMRSARDAGILPLWVIAPADDPDVAAAALVQSGAGRVLGSLADLEELLP
jgi:phosphoglycolate phosphatase-like HAD superfamily hydrolase